MHDPGGTPEAENRSALNRARRLQAIRELDLLLGEAVHAEFRGTVSVEISAKNGRLAEPKATRVRFGSSE